MESNPLIPATNAVNAKKLTEEQRVISTIDDFNWAGASKAAKLSLRTMLPFIAARFLVRVTNYASNIIVARYGQQTGDLNAFPAMALISPVQSLTMNSGMAVMFMAGIYMKGASIKGEHAKVGHILHQAWLSIIPISIVVIASQFLSSPFLHLTKQDTELVDINQRYFYIYVAGVPAAFGVLCNQQFALATKNRKLLLGMSLLRALLVIGLSYTFVFDRDFSPECGTVGIAYANIVSNWLSLAVYLWIIMRWPSFQKYKIFSRITIDWPTLKGIIYDGFPVAVRTFCEIAGITTAALMVGRLHNHKDNLAAQQIVFQTMFLTGMPIIIAAGQVTGMLVKGAQTMKAYRKAKFIGNVSIGVGIFLGFIIALLNMVLRRQLTSFFVSINKSGDTDADVANIAISLFPIISLRILFHSVRDLFSGGFRGLHQTKLPMYVAIVLFLFCTPLAYALGFPAALGIRGIYGASVISMFLSSGYLGYKWLKYDNSQQQQVIESENTVQKTHSDTVSVAHCSTTWHHSQDTEHTYLLTSKERSSSVMNRANSI